MPDQFTAQAPAKVNLVLEVLGRREDGYHEIDTIFQTLDVADTVVVTLGSDAGIAVSGPCAAGTPIDASNLAWRAAAHLADLVDRSLDGVRIDLVKRIPAATGLGGGASDAATTLRLLQRAWRATDAHLFEAANAVGSDEASFLLGGTVRATGRGDRVGPAAEIGAHGVVLFVPPATIERKTAQLFAALDGLPFDDGTVAAAFIAHPPESVRGADVYNAFERVAFDLFPGLADLWDSLETRIGEPIHLAGAGPALFWIGPEREAPSVAARARGLPCSVIETHTSPSLWRR